MSFPQEDEGFDDAEIDAEIEEALNEGYDLSEKEGII